MDPNAKLTPSEDAELRRLHWFEGLGCHLSEALATLKDGIRSRDRRTRIRDPFAELGTKPEEAPPAPRVESDGGYWVRFHS